MINITKIGFQSVIHPLASSDTHSRARSLDNLLKQQQRSGFICIHMFAGGWHEGSENSPISIRSRRRHRRPSNLMIINKLTRSYAPANTAKLTGTKGLLAPCRCLLAVELLPRDALEKALNCSNGRKYSTAHKEQVSTGASCGSGSSRIRVYVL